ncbi:MAG: 3-methyl-2-oxobutanoate hydroxymethyltransferase [Gemmatimonadota bacterium]
MSLENDDRSAPRRKTVTVRDFQRMKREGEKIAVLTCYDFLFARLLSESAIDAVLVGDSVGQVLLGYRSTLPVTLDDMIHHTAAVRRGLEGPMLILDMPFLSYQVSDEEALRNAGRVMKKTGCEAVKLEGGDEATLSRVRTLVRAGIPVMGHVGLVPQSVHRLGGYRVTGREAAEAEGLSEQAHALEAAGCFSLVLEMVPAALAARISEALGIPTIGIGAGPHCDGQVLVLHDMLGLNDAFRPRFLRRFAELGDGARRGVASFVEAVKSGDYPSERESYDVE